MLQLCGQLVLQNQSNKTDTLPLLQLSLRDLIKENCQITAMSIKHFVVSVVSIALFFSQFVRFCTMEYVKSYYGFLQMTS